MTITQKLTRLIAAVLLLISCGLISCGEGSDEATSELRIDQQCTLTGCKAQEQQCQATTTSQCNSCWDTVSDLISYGGDFYDCTSICDSSSCYRTCPENDSCQQYGFSARLPQQRDEALYQACLQGRGRDQRCGLEATWNCDAYARVERIEATRVYQCIAQTPCGKSPDHCNDLPKTGVGQRYCDGFQKLCGAAPDACVSPDQLDINLFNWQRDNSVLT